MEERGHKEGLLAALRESLDSGDLESVKRTADSLHKVGGEPVAALSSMILNELPDCDQRTLALRSLEHLDSRTAASVTQRLRGEPELQGPPAGTLSAQSTGPQRDPSKSVVSG
jgi:hypothetical protein